MPSTANIYIKQATDFTSSVEIIESDNVVIDGSTFYADMKKLYSTVKVASFTTAVANNDVTISLSASNTEILEPGKYQYDVLVQEDSGRITKVAEGLAIVEPTMTRIT